MWSESITKKHPLCDMTERVEKKLDNEPNYEPEDGAADVQICIICTLWVNEDVRTGIVNLPGSFQNHQRHGNEVWRRKLSAEITRHIVGSLNIFFAQNWVLLSLLFAWGERINKKWCINLTLNNALTYSTIINYWFNKSKYIDDSSSQKAKLWNKQFTNSRW